jgi:hypothetical protein
MNSGRPSKSLDECTFSGPDARVRRGYSLRSGTSRGSARHFQSIGPVPIVSARSSMSRRSASVNRLSAILLSRWGLEQSSSHSHQSGQSSDDRTIECPRVGKNDSGRPALTDRPQHIATDKRMERGLSPKTNHNSWLHRGGKAHSTLTVREPVAKIIRPCVAPTAAVGLAAGRE